MNSNDIPSETDLDMLSKDLKGNSLFIYWFLMRNDRPFGAREIQRKVGLSSSSLALHHLNKLIELGLVKTNRDGQYLLATKIRPGILSLFVGTGILFMPRFAFYAIFMTGLLISSLIALPFPTDTVGVLYIFTLIFCTLVFWLETCRIWRLQPL